MRNQLAQNKSDPMKPETHAALRFISGKYQGNEFPLAEGREIVIGRSSDLELVLVEEMVSRRHARIVVRDGVVAIEDLGSTNGTFVNGEKIQRAILEEGDRVLIGTSILKLVTLASLDPPPEMASAPAFPRSSRPGQTYAPEEAPRMTGNLEDIPLPDLLQLFSTSRKSGVLLLKTGSALGRIYLKDGVIHFAAVDGLPQLHALKAVYRMLGWLNGVFALEPADPTQFEGAIDAGAQEVLMEGFRQQDELAAIRSKLPPSDARLSLRTPLRAPLHELEPKQLELLQQALSCPNLQALFDRSELPDLEVAQLVLTLIERGYLQEPG